MKINIRNALLFLIFGIYPILPLYFGIGGTSAFKLMCLVIVLVACLFFGISKTFCTSCKEVMIAFEIWLGVMFLNMIFYNSIAEFGYEVLCYYMVGIVAIRCLNSRERFLHAIDILILGAAIASIIGIVESFTGFNLFETLNTMGMKITAQPLRFGFKRIISFTFQTISFCNYCMFALCITFYRISICSKRNESKRKYIVAYCMVFIAAVLTLSRSILLCIIFSQFVLLYLCGYRVLIKKLLVIIALGTLIVFICSIMFSDIISMLQNIAYMLFALFDDNYASLLGNVDGTGIGDRGDLISWVWQSLDNKWIGMGGTADFSYSYETTNGIYSYSRTKTSIENQYLNLLYHYGIIGLLSMVWVYIQTFMVALRRAIKMPIEWEGRITFSKAAAVILLTYYISFFGVHQIDEKRIFFCVIFLLIAYCDNGGYS